MKAFRRSRHQFVSVFEPAEGKILSSLASQLIELIEQSDARDTDPAVTRLFPNAYPDDPEASEEYHRFTIDDLSERKKSNARQIVADLAPAIDARSATTVKVSAQSAQAWVRSLTDIRLTIATRLEIHVDDDPGVNDPELLYLYEWLGFVQASLVDCLDR